MKPNNNSVKFLIRCSGCPGRSSTTRSISLTTTTKSTSFVNFRKEATFNFYHGSNNLLQQQSFRKAQHPSSAYSSVLIRHFSSSISPPEKDDENENSSNSTTESDNENIGASLPNEVDNVWDGNDFAQLLKRKNDEAFSSLPSDITTEVAASDSTAATTTAVPWEPFYYNPVDLVVESIRMIHETTGLEYAWCLVSFITLVRLGLFPLQVIAMRNNSRIAEVGWIRNKLSASLNMHDPKDEARLEEETKRLLQQRGVKGFYSVLPQIATIPCAIVFVLGYMKMATVFHEELAMGGVFWFPDLTSPDPYVILPIVNAATYLGVTEWVRNKAYDPFSPISSKRTYFRRGIAFLLIPSGASLSSALVLSWETFYLISFGHVLFFQNRTIKKWLGIWEAPDVEQPNRILRTEEKGEDAKSKRAIRRGGRKR